MKKRIIVSAMASVMALSNSAAALVASAAVEDYKTENITKSQLRKFLEDDEIVDLVNGGINEFGSSAGERFLKAIDYATAVAEGGSKESTDEDATVAYQMVKVAKSKLVKHSLEELRGLVEESTEAYNTSNELNKEGDLIWDGDAWSEFESAYLTAVDALESEDSLVITDAFDMLDDVYHNRIEGKELDKMTKQQINNAHKDFEAALKLEFAHQPWERGTVKNSGNSLDGGKYAWGILYQYVSSGKDDLIAAYDAFNAKGIKETTNENTIAAIKAMQAAADALTNFNTTRTAGGESNVRVLLKKYNGQMLYVHAADRAQAVLDSLISVTKNNDNDIQFKLPTGKFVDATDLGSITVDNKENFWNVNINSDDVVLEAKLEVKLKSVTEDAVAGVSTNTDLYYVLDKDVKLPSGFNAIMLNGSGQYFFDDKDAAVAFANDNNGTFKTLSRGGVINIENFVSATAADVAEATIEISTQPAGADAMVTAIGDVKTAISSIIDKIDAALTAVSNTAVSTSNAATTLTADTRTTIMSLLDTASDEANELKKAADAASVAADLTPTLVDNVRDAYDDFNTAFNSFLNDATSTAFGDLTTAACKALTSAVDDTLVGYFDAVDAGSTGDGAFTQKETAYDVGYQTAVETAASTATMDALLELTDKAKKNGWADENGDGDSFKTYSYKQNGTTASFSKGAYESSKYPDGSSITSTSLAAALKLYELFKNKNWDDITKLDNINDIVDVTGLDRTDSNPRPQAWNLLYNYMKYALEDEFAGNEDTTWALKDVEDLIKKANALGDKTIEVDMFNASHVAMVEDRTGANEWVAQARDAKKGKSYTEYYTPFTVATRRTDEDKSYNSTAMYEWLNTSYKQLDAEDKAFAYSYQQIIDDMADIAKRIDDKEFSADVADKLKADLQDVALKLMLLGEEGAELVQSTGGAEISVPYKLFNDDNTMNKNNRLFTKDSDGSLATGVKPDGSFIKETVKKNAYHSDAKKAYEKLLNDLKAATEKPESKVVDDVNGDGKFNLTDVSDLFTIVLSNKGEVEKHDFTGDGKVDLADVTELFRKQLSIM